MLSSYKSLSEQFAEAFSDKHVPDVAKTFSSHAYNTHIGRVRSINEDAYLALPEQQFWLVADGMGGHKRGDFASRCLTHMFEDFERCSPLRESVRAIEQRIEAANARCRDAFRQGRPGTTMAALLVQDGLACVVWAGDSRVYRYRSSRLQQLTCDHNLLSDQNCGAGANATDADASSAHILTRAIGVHRRAQPELVLTSIVEGDRFLLCTDGVFREQSDEDLERLLDAPSAHDATTALVDSALKQGGRDNITAIVLDAQ